MKTTLIASCFAALVLAACSGETTSVNKPVDSGGAATGHEREHGERQALGGVVIGPHTISVFQLGGVPAGKEADFDLDFPAGKPLPGTVRGWIGEESGKGSMKVRFAKETDTRMHGHPEVPSPLAAGSRFWLEIEADGSVVKGSVAIKP